MSYDQNRTNILPPVGFPITEELPVVTPRRGPGGSGFLKIAAVLLIGAIGAIAAVLIIDSQRSDQVSTGGDIEEPTPTAEADGSDEVDAPTPVELEDTEPGFWRVTGVADGLNVRSGPGTNNDIVGALGANDRHIFGTGERATVNGAEWTQIMFGDNDTIGWVSARFLTTDTAPDPDAPTPTPAVSASVSVVCFESERLPRRIARLEFADRINITGVIRTIEDQTATDQTVTGTLANSTAVMTLTNPASGASSQRRWTFNPANVELGNGIVLSVVDCASVAGDLPAR